jgi:thymidylate synthase (FAD)
MRIVREPEIYLLGRQAVDEQEVARFLANQGATWTTDSDVPGEQLAELAGRTCYMSFGQGRKTNAEYLGNIIERQHGSVLEHAVWNFLITGVSRSFTHELVRHRAGTAFSQLSQRYVDESTADFVEPAIIASDPELHMTWLEAIEVAHQAYRRLADGLTARIEAQYAYLPKTHRRKMAREAARSVLPNATETKIFFSCNARELRHIIELRGDEGAEPEIRRFAVKLLRIMQREAPNLFGDFTIYTLIDGSEAVRSRHHKV